MEINKLQNSEINIAYSGASERAVSYLDTGEKVADKEIIIGLISDGAIISNITNSSNWTNDVYTGPAIVVYEGQYYYDSLYKYEAKLDNSIVRLTLSITSSSLWTLLGNDIYYNTGNVQTNKNVDLAHTTASDIGVITKDSVRWIHDFSHPTGDTAIPLGNNIFIGENSGNFTVGSAAIETWEGSSNIGIGSRSLTLLTSGFQNVAIGINVLNNATSGSSNTAVGYGAQNSTITGGGNTVLGNNSLYNNLAGAFNVAIGYFAGYYEIGSNKLYISSLTNTDQVDEATAKTKVIIYGEQSATTADQKLWFNSDVTVGYKLNLADTTADNLGVVYKEGVSWLHNFHHPTGSTAIPAGFNILIGGAGNFTMGSTAISTSHASYNIGIGLSSLHNSTIGHSNVGVGLNTIYANTEGNYNTAVGVASMVTSIIGYNNISLGAYSGYYETGSNKLYISSINNTTQVDEATGKTKAIIYGTQSATTNLQTLALNAQVHTPYKMTVGTNLAYDTTEGLRFGDGDTGIYEWADDSLAINFATTDAIFINSTVMRGATGERFSIALEQTISSTVPIYSFRDDEDTGINRAAANQLSFIAGGVEGIRVETTKSTFSGNIELAHTESTTTGVVTKAGIRFLHDFSHPTGGGAIPQGNNIFLGENAGNFTVGSTAINDWNGSNNVGIGNLTLLPITIGFQNTAIGNKALYNVTTGNTNTAVGFSALTSLISGKDNLAVGDYSFYNNSSGLSNIGIGSDSGYYETGSNKLFIASLSATEQVDETTARNMAIIYGEQSTTTVNQTLRINANLQIFSPNTYLSSTGSPEQLTFTDSVTGTKTLAELVSAGSPYRIENTATTSYLEYGTSGADAFLTGHSTLTGDNSIFTLEDNADVAVFDVNAQGTIYNNGLRVFANHLTQHNIFIGDEKVSDALLATSLGNLVMGFGAGNALAGGDYNTIVGYSAGYNISTGIGIVALGKNAGSSALTGTSTDTINIGTNANAIGTNGVAIGNEAGAAGNGIGIGFYSQSQDAGNYNIGIGYLVRRYATVGDNNIVFGNEAGRWANGNYNIISGYRAGYASAFDGDDNTLFGQNSGYSLTTGNDNILIGPNAGYSLSIQEHNIFLGNSSGYTGAENRHCVGIGFETFRNSVGANQSIGIGYRAGYGANGTANIFIGSSAGIYETGSDTLLISRVSGTNEATARGAALLYGVMNAITANQTLQVNAALGIFNADTYLSRDGSTNLTFTDPITGTKTLAELAGGSLTNRIENTATTSYIEYGTGGNDTFATVRTSSTTVTDNIIEFEDGNGLAVGRFDAEGNYFISGNNTKSLVKHGTNWFLADSGNPLTTDYSLCNSNVGVGPNALEDVSAGGDTNTAIGNAALLNLTTGNGNVAIGYSTGTSMTTLNYSISIGYQANTNGAEGIAIGRLSRAFTGTVAIGPYANTADTTGLYGVILGGGAKKYSNGGDGNIIVGYGAGLYVDGNNNSIIGFSAGANSGMTGANNVLLGAYAGSTMTTQAGVIGIGYLSKPLGTETISIGSGASGSNYSIAIGQNTDTAVPTTAEKNISIGYRARLSAASGVSNIVLGTEAGSYTNGDNNVVIGTEAGSLSSFTGNGNIMIGYFAGSNTRYSNNSIYIGRYAGRYNDLDTADNNIAIGEEAQFIMSGNNNISLGYQSLYGVNGNDTWHRNITIGYQTGYSILSSNNILIGDYAGYWETDGNRFYLGNQQGVSEATNRAGMLMYGKMSATTAEQTLQINANLKTTGRIDEITTITADYIATIADYSIEIDASSSAIEIELPEPNTDNHGLRFEFDIYDDTNTIALISYSNVYFNVDTITSIGTPANTWRYTMNSAYDLSGISVSDKIKVTNSTNAVNDGIFVVTAVDDANNWLEVINTSGVAEASNSPSTVQETVFTDSGFVIDTFKTYRAYQNRNTYKRIN